MTKSHRRTWAAAIVITVLAVVLTVVGILTHSEAGLMTACTVDSPRDGATVYDYDGECFEVSLEGRAPFIVTLPFAFDAGGRIPKTKDYREVLNATVSKINRRVRFELLRVGDPSRAHEADILYFPEERPDEGLRDANGSAQHLIGGRGGVHCFVHTFNVPDEELEELVLMHEIGHCLGLAHDDFDSSIMRVTQQSTPMGQFPPSVTDSDVELLRSVYLNR